MVGGVDFRRRGEEGAREAEEGFRRGLARRCFFLFFFS